MFDVDLDNLWLRNNNQILFELDSSIELSLNLGKFEFNINYDIEIECLWVIVVVVYNLLLIYSISYVELYLLLERVEKYQIKIYYFNCSFVFNEEFQFDIGFLELLECIL